MYRSKNDPEGFAPAEPCAFSRRPCMREWHVTVILILAFLGRTSAQTGEFPVALPPETPVGNHSSEAAGVQDGEGSDQKIRRLADAGQPEIPVLVLLRHQPQREVLARHESQGGGRAKQLEARYAEVLKAGKPEAPSAQETGRQLESELLAIRQAAFAEIRSLIQAEQDSVADLIARLGGRIFYRYDAINMIAARISTEAVEELSKHPAVARITLDEASSIQIATSVPAFGAGAFWNGGFTGAGESVAVMDTGLKADHPAFQGLPIVNRTFLNNGSAASCFADLATSPSDLHGHGTHVAGIIASRGAPGWSSFLGVARGLGALYNLKTGYRNCNGLGLNNDSDVYAALDWLVQNAPAVKIINYSAGLKVEVDDDESARHFDFFADTYGLLFVISAGNESSSGILGLWTEPGPVTSPATGHNVISVASMNTQGTIERSDDEVSIFSSRGPTRGGRRKPDISAPGGYRDKWTLFGWQAERGIWSAAHNSNDFVAISGTSMAAPHIAGAAALLRSAGVRDPLAIKALLLNTTDTLGWDADKGWGYANLSRAYSQRNNVIVQTVSRGRVRLLKGFSSDRFYATLTWNRLVNSSLMSGCLSNLDLSLYRSDTGAPLRSSTSLIDNVEKVWADVSSPVVLSITHFGEGSCRESEKFGLAVSHPAFQETNGPVLQLTCNVPNQATPGSQFSVSCTIRNSGDLPAFSTSGQLALTGGSGASSQSFGVIQPSDSATRTWQVTAPNSPGSYTLALQAESTGFGARFSNAANFSFTVVSSTSCSILVSPTSVNTGPGSASFPVAVSAPAGCSWSATSNAPWITLSGTTQGTGSGAFTLSIAANTGNSTRTGTVSVGGQVITVRQDGQSSSPRTTRVLPQLAFGFSPTLGNWATELYLHNLTIAPAQVTVAFFGEDGTPLSVPKWGTMTVVNLGARGTAIVDVSTPGPLLQGSIRLDLPEGVTGYGIFRQTSPGLNPQEGVVPLSSASSTKSTIVFDETNFVTAVALCNPIGSPITVSAVARDEQGNTVGTAVLSLAGRQRIAFALKDRPELRSIEGKRGSVEFSSTGGSLSVLGLRFNGLAFTSILPVEQ